jgi:hypothetical protein
LRVTSRGLGDVYKRQALPLINENRLSPVLLNAMPIAEIKQRVLATI